MCQNFLRVWHLVIFRADQSKKTPCTTALSPNGDNGDPEHIRPLCPQMVTVANKLWQWAMLSPLITSQIYPRTGEKLDNSTVPHFSNKENIFCCQVWVERCPAGCHYPPSPSLGIRRRVFLPNYSEEASTILNNQCVELHKVFFPVEYEKNTPQLKQRREC